jgi:hypothetical protein
LKTSSLRQDNPDLTVTQIAAVANHPAKKRLNVTLDLRLRLRHWRREVFFRAGAVPEINVAAVHDPHVGAAPAAKRTQRKAGPGWAKNLKGRSRSHNAQVYVADGATSSAPGACFDRAEKAAARRRAENLRLGSSDKTNARFRCLKATPAGFPLPP